ncbi:hypothetical protein RIF29_10239 [Crotalaria pallida]|uniref:Uncharacterized protein n=1 Tax=Crotalaria pallida TaxID=3830 RepID=A0AAN9IJT0_CROPI
MKDAKGCKQSGVLLALIYLPSMRVSRAAAWLSLHAEGILRSKPFALLICFLYASISITNDRNGLPQ